MQRQRVVITGIGPVTAVGSGREAFADALRGATPAVGVVSLFPTDAFTHDTAAEIRDFNVEDYLESEKAYLDRSSEFALAAMALALEDADMDVGSIDRHGAALLFGSAYAGMNTMKLFYADVIDKGPRHAKPFLFPHTYSNTAISLLAIEYGLDGYHLNFASGMVSGALAVLEAYDLVSSGRCAVAFAGSSEALSEPVFGACAQAGLLANGPCRPFDIKHDGFVPGEGAAVLVIESLEHARDRGAHVMVEILGGGSASAARDGNGQLLLEDAVRRSVRTALASLPTATAGVDYVCAHANGSPAQDTLEAQAIASECSSARPAVSSIKSLIGETWGASGALQVSAAAAAISTDHVPATRGLTQPEADTGLDFVMEPGRDTPLHTALANSIDPGGGVVALALGDTA